MDTFEDNLADKPKIRQKHFAKQFGLQNKLPIFVAESEMPCTFCKITPQGIAALEEYIKALKTYIIK